MLELIAESMKNNKRTITGVVVAASFLGLLYWKRSTVMSFFRKEQNDNDE